MAWSWSVMKTGREQHVRFCMVFMPPCPPVPSAVPNILVNDYNDSVACQNWAQSELEGGRYKARHIAIVFVHIVYMIKNAEFIVD